MKKNKQMRSIKELTLNTTHSIFKSLNNNRFNLILTPRQWGLTTLLINYINQIPHDKSVLFGVANSGLVRDVKQKITHPNCRIQAIHESGLIGYSFDYIICDNIFNNAWIQKLVLIAPVLKNDGKIILADTGQFHSSDLLYFRNYNKIIKTNLD